MFILKILNVVFCCSRTYQSYSVFNTRDNKRSRASSTDWQGNNDNLSSLLMSVSPSLGHYLFNITKALLLMVCELRVLIHGLHSNLVALTLP